MKTSYLFPYRFKRICGIVFWTSLICLTVYFSFGNEELYSLTSKVFAISDSHFLEKSVCFGLTTNNIVDELLFLTLIISGLVYAFSKEKTEDEMVSKIRLDSLVWATYFNYIIILLCYMLVYGFAFLNVMMVALFSHLLFFIIRFRWLMYKQNKISDYEE